jgi:hypothetical protein
MPRLLVSRDAHTRRGYKRRDGTHVKGCHVPASTFSIKDRGKPGRTPKSHRFYHPKVHMGWHKGDPMKARRARALRAHKGNVLATGRALQALANVTTDRPTKREASKDALYFFRKLN